MALAIWTDLSRHLDEETTATIGKTGGFWKSQDQGAATMLVAAFDPALNGESASNEVQKAGQVLTIDCAESSGVYLNDCQIAEPAPHASDKQAAEKLWHLSEELVGEAFDLEAHD